MKITIEEYKDEWNIDFEKEKERIIGVLSDLNLKIEHIGSTSISGLGAKPVIDILIGLRDFLNADAQIDKMVSIGYEYINQYEEEMPYRRFFIKEREGVRTHHIHMVEMDTDFWKRHLAFRDYLRNHPIEKQEYYKLKKELSQQEWKDGNEYAAAKSFFIKEIERKATGQ